MSDYTEKVPPHNLEAEQAVLGALLLDFHSMGDIITILRPEKFYSLQHQIIFDALINLYRKNLNGDLISLIDELKSMNKLDQAGGEAYLASLTDVVPSSEGIFHWAEIIISDYTRRELIKLGLEIRTNAFDATRESDLLVEEAEQKIFNIAEKNETTVVHSAKDVMITEIDIIQKRFNSKNLFTGIPTGFAKLDTYTSGFQNSELIIIGARPSIGKTALALSMMQYIAVEKNIPCGFFSLEMPYESIGMRILSQEARVPMARIRNGFLRNEDVTKIQNAAGRWFDSPLYIVDTPNMRLMELRAAARRMKINQDVKIIFIDYIGLITTDNPKAEVYTQVSEISKSLKALARELKIPIVALCQVSRDSEGQEPNLAQLRGSGSIEQDADVVMFLHRERLKEEVEVQDAKIILAKQRNGATGDINIMYVPMFTKFENKSEE